jgi:hypothetical protein
LGGCTSNDVAEVEQTPVVEVQVPEVPETEEPDVVEVVEPEDTTLEADADDAANVSTKDCGIHIRFEAGGFVTNCEEPFENTVGLSDSELVGVWEIDQIGDGEMIPSGLVTYTFNDDGTGCLANPNNPDSVVIWWRTTEEPGVFEIASSFGSGNWQVIPHYYNIDDTGDAPTLTWRQQNAENENFGPLTKVG